MTATATPPSFDTIRLDLDDAGIALCSFNRPEVRNALNEAMVDDIRAALQWLAKQPMLTAVIFTGAGEKAFVSGADIAELRDRTHADALRRINSQLFREVELFPAPTIAAIRGYALGGGCELAMACDLRVVGEGAKLGQPEVGLGIIPAAGATYRMQRLVGLGTARELIFTGRIIDARTAHSIGLVNRVVADDQVIASARELAAEIAKNSAQAVRMAKVLLNGASEISADGSMALESAAQALLFDSADKHARMTAFLEKRKK